MEWFTSVEFYVLAVTIAIVMVGAVFNPPPPGEAFSYVYTAKVQPSNRRKEESDEERISIKTLSDGAVEIVHEGVLMPLDALVVMRLEVNGNKIRCEEKIQNSYSTSELVECDVSCVTHCMKKSKYHVRYECEYSDKWCTTTYLNREDNVTYSEMKH